MKNWNGEERRKMNQEERDILIRLDQNVTNLVKTLEIHIKSDFDCFKEQGGRIKVLERVIWMGFGVIGFISIILKFVKI